jgi:hypothetical protein
MAGLVHLRVVMALFIIGGCLAILSFALSPLIDESFSALGAIFGVVAIVLAVWLSRGSTIARVLLIVLSIVGLAVYVITFFLTLGDSWLDAIPLAVLAVLSAYCLWVLTFSEDLRAELASRRARSMK